MSHRRSIFHIRPALPPPGLILTSLLFAAPLLLFLGALRRGEIPYFMDTLMYFFPLRVHAAHLLAAGEWPLWNRCLMGGVPLFENPQAALAYPGHWPFLLQPGGFWFTLPMLAQLGLWAALTCWAARRIGAGRWAAFFAGALTLAGSYGWSRLQFGNYLNVLPWWPLWLGAAHAFAAAGGALWLAVGGLGVALMLLGGAHQLAAYGLAGLGLYALAQAALARGRRGRWLLFLMVTFGCGVAIAAPGWLPQAAFLKETSRPQGLAAGEVLQGTIGSWSELARALAGDWPLLKGRPGEPWSDAESSAAIGLVALALALIAPRRRSLRHAWLGAWAAALLGGALSLRVVMEPLLRAAPQAGIFHDPRRWLGLTQWMLALAAGLGAATLGDYGQHAWRRASGGRIWTALVFAPPLIGGGAVAATLWSGAPRYAALNAALLGAVLVAAWLGRRRAGRAMLACALGGALALLAHATWVTTDLAMTPVGGLLDPKSPPPIARAGLNPGQRFFTMDWQRAASYDYRRPDLADWALPNLACLWGLEDLGGYEPAQSERYRAFMRRVHEGQPWRQAFPQHFGLVGVAKAGRIFDEANVRAAIFPRWGVPLYFAPTRDAGVLAAAYPAGLSQNFQARVLVLNGDTSERLQLQVRQGENAFTYATAPLHPVSAGDDLAALPGEFGGERPEAPGAGRLMAGGADMPPQFGEPPLLLLGAPARGRVIDGYVWNADLAEIWKPVAMSEIAAVMRYQGNPAWVAWPGGEGEVLTKKIAANRIELEVDVKPSAPGGAARMVVHDAWWPGWRAWVDGKEARIEAEGLWRAIALAPGRHAVAMEYRPPLVADSMKIAGAGLAALAAITALAAGANALGRRRRAA